MLLSAADKMTELQANTASVVQVTFLEYAFRELWLNRVVLKSSYPLHYFMPVDANSDSKEEEKCSAKEESELGEDFSLVGAADNTFDKLQAQLHHATEKLSGYI